MGLGAARTVRERREDMVSRLVKVTQVTDGNMGDVVDTRHEEGAQEVFFFKQKTAYEIGTGDWQTCALPISSVSSCTDT